MTIEEDGLLWLHACYGRGVDAFNAEDMLRAYEAGRAYPTTSCWKMREGWYGGPAQDVSREGKAGSRSATEPDANLAGPEGDARPLSHRHNAGCFDCCPGPEEPPWPK